MRAVIRYRIGDVGTWRRASARAAAPCRACETSRVVSPTSLSASDGRLVSGVFLATYVVAHRPSLGQVQIHQDQAGEVLYRISPQHDFAAADDLTYLEGNLAPVPRRHRHGALGAGRGIAL